MNKQKKIKHKKERKETVYFVGHVTFLYMHLLMIIVVNYDSTLEVTCTLKRLCRINSYKLLSICICTNIKLVNFLVSPYYEEFLRVLSMRATTVRLVHVIGGTIAMYLIH